MKLRQQILARLHQRICANHQSLFVATTVICMAALGGLIYWATVKPPLQVEFKKAVWELSMIYRTKGLAAFLEEKKRLRDEVWRKMNRTAGIDAKIEAANIALYLFPDLLADEDFEKDVAMDLWAPLQRRIEEAPGTAESRKYFDEMQAHIWNYENPSRSTPEISEQATVVLKVYENLSHP